MQTLFRPGPYFIKVKIILSLEFKINLIFYLIKEFMKHSCLNFFYEIVTKISIKGLLHLLPQKAPKLACFVLYLQITDIFLKNDICTL